MRLRIFVQIRILTKVLEEMELAEKLISSCKCYNEYFISYASLHTVCVVHVFASLDFLQTSEDSTDQSLLERDTHSMLLICSGKLQLFHLYNNSFLLKITIPLSRYMVLLFAYYTQYLKFFYFFPSFPLHPLYLLFLTLFLIYRSRYFTFFSHMLQCLFVLLQFTYIIIIIPKYDVSFVIVVTIKIYTFININK